ncbi:high-affinity iron transporter, partial [Lecanoromycetidae sp. Uapishka_2]
MVALFSIPSHDDDLTTYKRLKRQIWFGTGLGMVFCIIIGGGLIGAFYGLGKDRWSGTEDIWESTFSLLATIIISIMGAALLRVSKLQDKWRVKLAKALESKDNTKKRGTLGTRFKRWAEKYAMFLLPFVTVLREGLEAVIFIGGWNKLVGGDAAETGSGPGSYDIRKSVWHVNCCNAEINGGGGWGIFNALFGWENSATYGSVISYNLYWASVILVFLAMRYNEKKGHWPLIKAKTASANTESDDSNSDEGEKVTYPEKNAKNGGIMTRVRSMKLVQPA